MIRFSFLWLACGLLLLSCGSDEQPAGTKPSVDNANKNQLPQPASTETTKDDNVEQSLNALEKRHALVPSDPALAYDLAYAYAEAKNAKAVTLADSLIKAKTQEIEKAFYIKADYYSRVNSVKEALTNYDAAIAANLHFLDAQIDKGRLLYKQKQYAEALKAFAIGQKLSPAEPMFYFWIAKTQEATDNKIDAKANYERAYALDKTLTEAREAAVRLE